jgi:hypothetical protein
MAQVPQSNDNVAHRNRLSAFFPPFREIVALGLSDTMHHLRTSNSDAELGVATRATITHAYVHRAAWHRGTTRSCSFLHHAHSHMAGETGEWVGARWLRVPGPADAEKWGGGLFRTRFAHTKGKSSQGKGSGAHSGIFVCVSIFAEQGLICSSERTLNLRAWWRSSADRHGAFALHARDGHLYYQFFFCFVRHLAIIYTHLARYTCPGEEEGSGIP